MTAFVPALSRREFLTFSLQSVTAFVTGTLLAPFRSVFAGKKPPVPACVCSLASTDNVSGRVVGWYDEKRLASSRLLWRAGGEAEMNSVPAEETRVEIEDHTVFVYRAVMRGLAPGRRYEFTVECEGKRGALQTFSVDDGGAFKMLVFPDSQSVDGYTVWDRVARDASERFPDAALWVNMGDLTDNGESWHQWRDWFHVFAPYIGGRLFVPIMGNHECYSLEWTMCLPRVFRALFPGPENGSEFYKGYYWSFDYGPVHFTVVNTQREEIDTLCPGLFDEQAAWLRRDLSETKKPWRVVLMHRDLVDYDAQPPRRDPISETLVPVFEEAGVDAVLTAHVHAYRRRLLKDWKRDSRGVLYIATGNAGNCYYELPPHEIDDVKLPDNANNYLVLEADERKLSFRCFLENGVEKDSATLYKLRRTQPAEESEA